MQDFSNEWQPVFCNRHHYLTSQTADGRRLDLGGHSTEDRHTLICKTCEAFLKAHDQPLQSARSVWHPRHYPKPELPPKKV